MPFKYAHGGAAFGAIRSFFKVPGLRTALQDEINGWNSRLQAHCYEDFLTAGGIFTGTGVKTAGTVTTAVVANTADGIFRLATDATNEAQSGRLTFNDQLVIPGAKRPKFWALVKLPTVAANERVVIGLGSNYNATFNSMTRYMRFRLEANMNLLVETNDGSTAQNAVAVNSNKIGVLTGGQQYLFGINADNLNDIRFWVNDVDVTPSTAMKAASIASSGSGLLQPFIAVQKDSGTDVLNLDVDWVRCRWDRTNYA